MCPAPIAVRGLAGGVTSGDKLQQRVLLSYSTDGPDDSRVSLKIGGLAFRPQQVLGVSLQSAPPLTLRGVLEVPFGNFEVLYNDGSVRVVRTQQGFYGVNRRMEDGDGW